MCVDTYAVLACYLCLNVLSCYGVLIVFKDVFYAVAHVVKKASITLTAF